MSKCIIDHNGTKEWYLNGEEYSKDEFILLQFSKGIITND